MSTDSTTPSTEELVARELARAVEPLVEAVEEGGDGISAFLKDAGLGEEAVGQEAEKVLSTLESGFAEPAAVLRETVLGGEPSVEDVDALLEAVAGVYQGIQELDDLQVDSLDVDALGRTLLDHLLVSYLDSYRPGVYGALSMLGIIVEDDDPGAGRLRLSEIGTAVQSPNELPKEVFGWASESEHFRAALLLTYLRDLLWSQGIAAAVEPPPADEDLDFGGPSGGESQLRVPLVSYEDRDGNRVVAGFRLVPLPGGSDALPGIAVLVYGQVASEVEEDLDGWTFNVSASGDLAGRGLSIRPDTDGALSAHFVTPEQDSGDELHVEAGISRTDSSGDGSEKPILGAPGGTGLYVGEIGAASVVDYADGNVTFGVELPTSGRLVVSPEGGFLADVLPEDFDVDFDATVGWSDQDGVYLEGGGAIEAAIPLHLDLGVATVDELYLALDPTTEDADLAAVAATSPTVELGPLTGDVKRLGLQTDVSFPAGADGNAGPLDVAVGFRPPSRIGLGVDTGPVTGSGFLEFEPDKHRYAGALDLEFSSWGLTVVGLLKTKLPGTDGFSLLLLVTGDLPQIQLGFGFVLTGIGGLAGVHRGFEEKPLGKAVRSGSLDSVLFPDDVVENADQIITDLRAIFPPKADKHVFGPMVRLAWGTPVVLQAELGVLVALPDWKISLLGKFMVDLPDEEVALIDINLAIAGTLDVPGKELSLDASLYDSRIIQWTVSGDMALRLSWGDDARFLLSLGGFHPRYTPPKGFPELDRITAQLAAPGGNPSLELTGYLAITSNTFQVGAGVALHGEFGPATVDGELSFDALFRFAPFEFVVDFFASVSVEIKGKGLGLELDGTLSGPQPYNVRGKLTIDILFISVTVTVDATFGPTGGSKELPTANVLEKVAGEIGTPANWSAQDPAGGSQYVTLRDPDADDQSDGDGQTDGEAPSDETVLAHPRGRLAVRQQVVPLGTRIEKFGNARPAHDRFELAELSVSGIDESLGGQRRLDEKFAPAKFEEMSDSEKLEAQPFQDLPAGRTVENGFVHYAGSENDDLLSWATLEYESSVIDQENERYRTTAADVGEEWTGRLDLTTGHELAEQSAVATADTRTSGPEQYANPDPELSVSVSEQRFVVAWRDTLERLDVQGNPKEGRTRVEALDRLAEYVANSDADEDELQVVGVQELAGGSGGATP